MSDIRSRTILNSLMGLILLSAYAVPLELVVFTNDDMWLPKYQMDFLRSLADITGEWFALVFGFVLPMVFHILGVIGLTVYLCTSSSGQQTSETTDSSVGPVEHVPAVVNELQEIAQAVSPGRKDYEDLSQALTGLVRYARQLFSAAEVPESLRFAQTQLETAIILTKEHLEVSENPDFHMENPETELMRLRQETVEAINACSAYLQKTIIQSHDLRRQQNDRRSVELRALDADHGRQEE